MMSSCTRKASLQLAAIMAFGLCAPLLASQAEMASRGQPHRPYQAVRAELIRRGILPLNRRHAADDPLCADGFCKKYPEVVDCAGTGLSPCLFAFKAKGANRYYAVTTVGELHPMVTAVKRSPLVQLQSSQSEPAD